MLRKLLLGVVIGAGSIVGVVGCDKAKETTAEKTKEAADKAKVEADKAAKDTMEKAKEAEAKAKTATEDATKAAKDVAAEMGKNVKDLQDSAAKDMPAIEAKFKELTDKAAKATGPEKITQDAQVKEATGYMTSLKEKLSTGLTNLKDNASFAKAKDEINALIASLKKSLGI